MNRNLFIVCLISFVNALSISLVIPVIYLYAKSFGLTDLESSMLLAVFSLSQFVATPIIGRLSDYFGRKPLLAVSLIGTMLANLLSYVALAPWILFLSRILDGITGGNNSVAQAVISDTTEPKDRAKGFGLFGAAFGLAFIIGPIISLFAQRTSLATPYLFSAVAAFIAAMLTIFVLPETLKQKETKKFTFGNLGFVQIFTALKLPIVGIILIVSFLSTLSFGIFQFAFQPFVVNVFGKGNNEITVILIIYGFISVFMQAFAIRKLITKFNLINLLLTGLIGAGLALIGFALSNSFETFMIVVPLFAVLGSIARPILSTLISTNARPEDQGVALGVSESYVSLATTIGPLLGGALVGSGYTLPLIIAGSVSILAGLIVLIKRRNIRNPNAKKKDF